jgi:class 3 adenylate cyclase
MNKVQNIVRLFENSFIRKSDLSKSKHSDSDRFILKRRTYGLRATLWILCFFAFLTLIQSIIFPSYAYAYSARIFSITMLITFSIVGVFGFIVRENNYNKIFISTVLLLFATFFLVDHANTIETAWQENPSPHMGRQADYLFQLPALYILLSAMLMRPVVTIIAIVIFSSMVVMFHLDLFSQGELYFSIINSEWQGNLNTINQTWYVFSIIFFVIVSFVSLLLSWITNVVISDASKEERLRNALGRYFSPEIRDEIGNIELAFESEVGKEQQVAVLFTDIKNFTRISEKLKPEEVVELLSNYQKRMIASVFQNKGTVDKFIGDATMATFGTPRSRGNDAQNALDCARSMQIALRQWNKDRLENNEDEVEHRIGINIGSAIVGNIGSEDRVEYTVIGDPVNVASRILENCKKLERDVLVSDDVYKRLDEKIETEEFDDIELRGRDETIKLHSVVL